MQYKEKLIKKEMRQNKDDNTASATAPSEGRKEKANNKDDNEVQSERKK